MNKNSDAKKRDKSALKNASFFSLVLGKIQWSSPPWFAYLRTKAKKSPKVFLGSLITFISLLALSAYLIYWYQHLPKPQLVTMLVSAPKITPLAEDLYPDKLTIDFVIEKDNKEGGRQAASVAPLADIKKEVQKGLVLKPDFKGVWLWESDNRLVFTPEKDWPAGQDYQVEFQKDFFAKNAKMARHTISFSTQPFKATLSEFILYQDPVNSNLKEAVATIDFNFPVNAKSLKTKISLVLQKNKDGKSKPKGSDFPFALTFDKHLRKAYLHSKSLQIEKMPRYLFLTVDKGIASLSGTATSKKLIQASLLIPDAQSYFKPLSMNASIIRNDKDRSEQVLNLETSLGVTEKALSRSLHVFLLPQNKPATKFEKESLNYSWANPGEVTPAVLANASPLTLVPLPTERNYASLHSYKFQADSSRYLYVKLDKGTEGFGGFALSRDYVAVLKVPEFPKEISFLHKEALLALSSEKKLSILVRGLPAVKFEIARVLPDNVNQLVTQTEGDFNNPYFMNQSFTQNNIAEIFSEIQNFDLSYPGKQNYTTLDLEKYLANPSNREGPKGLFLLHATGWDPSNNTELDVKSKRLILITDMGLIVKDNSDGTHEVFVQSISTGQPLAQVMVSILGKNGLSIHTATSDEKGHVSFPNLKDFIEDKEPTVYLAQNNADISFIPYNKMNRQLNFSRFDIGGLYSGNSPGSTSLTAFLFTDRGIYRPSDTAHIAMIVKQIYAGKVTPGLPLQVTITDPRGMTVFDEKYPLNASGYLSFDFKTRSNTPTGLYNVTLYTVKDDHPDSYLGSTSFRISEFLPDRMRMSAKFSKEQAAAWVSPASLEARVKLANLYGAAAVDRRISARIFLTPEVLKFKEYPDYVFLDPMLDPKKPPKVYSETLADVTTNKAGEAEIHLNLDRFDEATYQLKVLIEGFEAEGGRSVSTEIKTLVSPRPYFIGYKADGDLNYIQQDAKASVHFIAVNPSLQLLPLNDLKLRLFSLQAVSTLIKKEDGTYQYQSIMKSKLLSENPFSLSDKGNDFALASANIGDYEIKIVDKNNMELSHFTYRIVGASQRPLPRNAELQVVLNKEEYQAGEDIELQITSPYAGSGLITIERDKVYAMQWFKADTNNSIQKIHIPEDLQGDAYVNIALVRDWNSPEIFISPLSYTVLPFKLNHTKQDIQIDLQTPELAFPGDVFNIRYKTDKPSKIIVYAVDEGILQVSKYQTPDPLAFFFQKHALEVLTLQTVDQILPNYVEKRELSSVGGDGYMNEIAAHLNPFKRKTDLAVVYWSGIIDSDIDFKDLSFQIPDYFNGRLRVMAVAVSEEALGHTEKSAEVRGHFVISPNVPSFVSPNDSFEVTVTIANNVKDSGANAKVLVDMKASAGLEIKGRKKQVLLIPEGQEKTLSFNISTKAILGEARIDFKASLGDKASSYSTSLSIRPASAYMTSLQSGYTQKTSLQIPLLRNVLKEHREVEARVSTNPLILVHGLQQYLQNFPYGCTEQLISKVFPLLAMKNQPQYMDKQETMQQKIVDTISMLSQRQITSGGFAFWPNSSDHENIGFISVYAMHFLTEARSLNLSIPNDLYYAGIAYLKELASQQADSLQSARTKAYAIYLLTRNEIVTTAYLTGLQLYLEKNQAKLWKKDITGAYIAAAYKLLQSEREANALIGLYQIQNKSIEASDFFDANVADAQYLYLVAHHFPDKLANIADKLLMPMVAAMNTEAINTILSSYISLALDAYGKTNAQVFTNTKANNTISILEQYADKTEQTAGKADETIHINDKTKSIKIDNPDGQMIFYQLSEAGFDAAKKQVAMQQGIEIFREYRTLNNPTPLQSASLGSEIEVHIQARALDNRNLSNIAIVDLLPGGFEVVQDSVAKEEVDYADVREDRVVFFVSLNPDAKEIIYRIKASNKGDFSVPPIYAESMYFPGLRAQGIESTLKVE